MAEKRYQLPGMMILKWFYLNLLDMDVIRRKKKICQGGFIFTLFQLKDKAGKRDASPRKIFPTPRIRLIQ